MKRRSFLQLLTAAIATPALPATTPAQAAGYSRAAWHGALLHARTRISVSTFGLAHVLQVPMAQAEALMSDLAKRNVIGQLQGASRGGAWASSKIVQRHPATIAAARKVKLNATSSPADDRRAPRQMETDLTGLLSHLRQICLDRGMSLSPRCFA